MLSVSADNILLPDTVLALHLHPLLLVDLLKRPEGGESFGLSKTFSCSKCKALGYRFVRHCSLCRESFCQSCFRVASEGQDAAIREIIEEELAAAQQSQGYRLNSPDHKHDDPLGVLSPILVACIAGNIRGVTAIVEKNEFSNSLDIEQAAETGEHKGKSLLLLAAQHGHREIVMLLVSRGAQTEKCDRNGMTPLMHASFCGHIGVVDELLFAGVDVNRAAFSGYSAVHFAANSGRHDILQRLIAAGARTNLRTPRGRTPLIIAAFNGHLKAVELLLSVSTDAEVRTADEEGYTAIDAAIAMQHVRVERCILGRLARCTVKQPRSSRQSSVQHQ